MNKRLKSDSSLIAGIDRSLYSQYGATYAKSQITWWLIAGLIYSIFAGSFISITTLILIFPGIFIVSISSIPFFLLQIKKIKVVSSMVGKDDASQIPVLAFFTITTILGSLFPIILSIIYVNIFNGLF